MVCAHVQHDRVRAHLLQSICLTTLPLVSSWSKRGRRNAERLIVPEGIGSTAHAVRLSTYRLHDISHSEH
eukprot:6206747-Pleurochrysis_carterae.AAC.12